jgi:hypothetical protein
MSTTTAFVHVLFQIASLPSKRFLTIALFSASQGDEVAFFMP